MFNTTNTTRSAPNSSAYFGLSGMSEADLLRQLESAEVKLNALKEELQARRTVSPGS
ncbi:hypothetical protein [Muricoccus aerilatus]|uniref:hypothetical protein n=1 Tax=Muricoccus aerilatus TaxID=452982 RepID=UPI0012EBD4C3|nr:hypothetical protein [Roseomonas aerilata]